MVTKLLYIDVSDAKVKLLIEGLFLRCQSSRQSKHKKKDSTQERGGNISETNKSVGKPQQKQKVARNQVSPSKSRLSPEEFSESPKRQGKTAKEFSAKVNLSYEEFSDDDEDGCIHRNVYYEPLLKLPRLELLADWD